MKLTKEEIYKIAELHKLIDYYDGVLIELDNEKIPNNKKIIEITVCTKVTNDKLLEQTIVDFFISSLKNRITELKNDINNI